MKKLFLLIIFIFLGTNILLAQYSPGISSLNEQDGAPDCYGWQVKATNGTVTDNGDGSCSLDTSGISTTGWVDDGIYVRLNTSTDNVGIGTTVPRQSLDVDGGIYAHRVYYDTNATPATNVEGLLQWNATDGTLDLGMSGGDVTMQVGQEMFTKVVNKTGSQIDNGEFVYFCGRQGARPKICLAQGDAEATSRVAGLTTQDIGDDAEGYITTAGYVRNIKTDYDGWDAGDILYLSTTIAGAATVDEPVSPHHSDIIGSVGIVHQNLGSILVNFTDRHKTLKELSDVNGTPFTADGTMLRWESASSYFDADPNIYSVGTNIGIGTIAPLAKLEVGNGGTPTYPAITNAGDAYIHGDVEIDGNLYVDNIIYGNNLQMAYATVSNSTDQLVTGATAEHGLSFDTNDLIGGGITHSTTSNITRITINEAGVYLITYSAALLASLGNKHLDIWLKVDGANVPNTNTVWEAPISGEGVMTVTYIYRFTAGQYFELFGHSEDGNITINATAAGTTPTVPVSPGIIVTVNKISR